LNHSHYAGRALFYRNTTVNLARLTRLARLVLAADGPAPEPARTLVLAPGLAHPHQAAQRISEHYLMAGRHGLVLWVETEEADNSALVQSQIADLTATHEQAVARLGKGSAVREIVRTAEDEQVALVILGKRGTTPIQDLMIGSTAEGVARESRRPVLLVPAGTGL